MKRADGTQLDRQTLTLRRETPKVRGKAARKALKRARRRNVTKSSFLNSDGRPGGFDSSEGTWTDEGLQP